MSVSITIKGVDITDTKKGPDDTTPSHSGTVRIQISSDKIGTSEMLMRFVNVHGGLSNAIIRALNDFGHHADELKAASREALSLYK